MASKNITVRPMTHCDIPIMIEMARAERWVLLTEDLRAVMEWTPTGCLAAEIDGRLVGFVTSFLSDGVGWWGNLLVRPQDRGKGVGRQLVQWITEALEAASARTLIVVAARGRESLYRQFGYMSFQDMILWMGQSTGGHSLAQGYRMEDKIQRALALDERAWRFSRGSLLRHLARRRELLTVSSPYAFLMHEPVKQFNFIGPWEASGGNKKAADEVLELLFSRLGAGASILLKSPADNILAQQILKEKGFAPVETEALMYRGQRPETDFKQIFAIATGGSAG